MMAAAGATAVAAAKAAYAKGNYILVVEGGVPTAFGGAAGWAWSDNGRDVTMLEAIKMYAAKAAKIVCAGTCASWGGIPSAPPNPAGIVGIKAATGKTTVNIAGCPVHPDWICWAIVQLLTNQPIAVDAAGRPTQLYQYTLHEICPRYGTEKAAQYGVDDKCLMNLGCRGPMTKCHSAMTRWNNGVSWCVEANAPCIGCTEPTFPGTAPFYPKQG
jgi:hydrogenase small subunit